MKRKLLILACSLLLLTGCSSMKATSDVPSGEAPQTTTESTAEENYDFYFGQIWEIPVEIPGISRATQKEPEMLNLFMTEPAIIEVGDNFLIAKGILTNEVFSTAEEITVQYDFSEYEGVNLIYAGNCLAEGNVTLTPAVPFTMDFLYDNAGSILIFSDESHNSVEYPLTKDTFILELSEDGWRDNCYYDGTITVTDNKGNKFQTINDYHFSYTIPRYTDNYRWEISGSDPRIAVRPIE